MSPTILKYPNGQLRGFIYRLSQYRIEIRNSGGVTLGWYNPSTDITYTSGGSMVGLGDLLTTLL